MQEPPLQTLVNDVTDAEFPEVTISKCVETHLPYKESKLLFLCMINQFLILSSIVVSLVCTRPGDEMISRFIEEQGAWEHNMVTNVMRAMDLVPDAVFIDGGSNIGVYTLAVAAMRRQVVAVDMMMDNLAYIRESLARAGLTAFVQLVNNAVRYNN